MCSHPGCDYMDGGSLGLVTLDSEVSSAVDSRVTLNMRSSVSQVLSDLVTLLVTTTPDTSYTPLSLETLELRCEVEYDKCGCRSVVTSVLSSCLMLQSCHGHIRAAQTVDDS